MVYIFFLFIRGLHLGRKKEKFDCQQCGKCCKRFKVPLLESDIKKIENRGHKKEFFVGKNNYIKKRDDKSCVFQKRISGKHMCSIHDYKPSACGTWPFNRYINGKVVFVRTMFKCPGLKKL
ncbi:MAG: YkgJ family cysteine cluster protein [Candidatus Aenigmarchaeota archaeon]|nr:YkgJ family cysteine cluster protein [Candidatus Aenigmarchaeota archaeon]